MFGLAVASPPMRGSFKAIYYSGEVNIHLNPLEEFWGEIELIGRGTIGVHGWYGIFYG